MVKIWEDLWRQVESLMLVYCKGWGVGRGQRGAVLGARKVILYIRHGNMVKRHRNMVKICMSFNGT